MIIVTVICIIALVALVAAYARLMSRNKEVETQLVLAQQQTEQQRQQTEQQRQLAAAATDRAVAAEQRAAATEQQLTNARIEAGQLATRLDAEKQHTSEQAQLREQKFNEQLKTVQEQFANLAAKVLSNTTEQFKSTNNEAMNAITQPLRDSVKQLSDAIAATNTETAKSHASLAQQLKAMGEQTDKIDQTATRLTNVIKGANKVQGNWGERILTDILDAYGYRVGIDYDVQQTITDAKGATVTSDSGHRMQPDVILHYPGNEDVIIDSKMSIQAYYDYVNTESETDKAAYAKQLAQSVRTQAAGLAKKDYSSYVRKPRRAIDFVVMFVPNEGALQLALATDPKLWHDAFERQVFITSQQNLMAILKIIQIAWRQYAQTENQKRVFDMAEEMIKRVGDFIKRFDKVKRDIDTLTKDYGDAYAKAYTGRQSVVQKARELVDLGVKENSTYPIPQPEISIDDDTTPLAVDDKTAADDKEKNE